MVERQAGKERRLPHHKLLAYGVAIQLLEAVRGARIRDAHLRDQAMRAAKSACLNAAEGAGRVTRADKARVFAIARAEALGAEVIMPRHRNPLDGDGGPNHWEIWLRDLDGYKVVLASPDGTADGAWRP